MKQINKRKSGGWKLWIIPVLFIALGGWLLRSQKDKILEKLNIKIVSAEASQTSIQVGDEVNLAGDLSSSHNLRLYTMTLTTKDQKTYGIKSSTLGLSSYRNTYVSLRGKVTSIVNGLPIIDVTSILTGNGDSGSDAKTSAFVHKAGVVVNPNKLTNYTFKKSTDSELIFAPITTGSNNKEVTLTFFTCTDDTSATGCKNAIKKGSDKFTGVDGDVWVKTADKTWMGSNANRIGYKANNVTKAQLQDIVRSLSFINDASVTSTYLADAKSACTDPSYTLKTTEKTTVNYNNGLSLILDGKTEDGTAITCTTTIDPTTAKVTLKNIIKTADKKTEEKKEEKEGKKPEEKKEEKKPTNGDEETNNDPSPSLAKPYTFKSSKGYSIVYPSSGIWFSGVTKTQKLGISGVSGCYRQMNVVKYSSKDIVKEKPAVIMYNCLNVKDKIGATGGLIRKDSPDGKTHFLIEVVNPKWKAFAEKITIQ